MSDFLTNLVMRSFAQTPSVQPMTLSTYATPEPQIIEPVQNTNERGSVIEKAPSVERAPLAETAPLIGKAPLAEVLTPPPIHFENPETRQPEPTPESVVQVVSKPDNTIAPPTQPVKHVPKPAIRVQKTVEPLLVEQVVEHIVERPTVRTIEHSTTETINRPSITSRERTIEHSSITIENTEHATNSFTTLVPKITPQSLPVRIPRSRSARSAQRPVDLPVEQETTQPVASPEAVINVAIGRIEVRATPAPTQRRERQQGPKVMTLDDYAQQRSRGAQ